ncbi:hypothetical protein Pcinc_031479 [Petrolisthes cinctipes]|uniref:Uncharacterized protein n=1 Tax=Petrolisthes cinctipes TaxID=88211 RepID=A0AAE1EWA1_PETCI|nr:hypothetical protein Pcinc_031479 [Petrolisthes cinctipes]
MHEREAREKRMQGETIEKEGQECQSEMRIPGREGESGEIYTSQSERSVPGREMRAMERRVPGREEYTQMIVHYSIYRSLPSTQQPIPPPPANTDPGSSRDPTHDSMIKGN